MFRVRAEFREDLEIAADVERVRAFFADVQNFARLTPGVESINAGAGEVAARWLVSVEVALVGRMRGEFELVLKDDSPQRIEWAPTEGENENLLRYAIGFEERPSSRTLVRFALRVELRRERAKDLHMMAGLIGERRVSEGVQEDLNLMLKTFLKRARAELEAR